MQRILNNSDNIVDEMLNGYLKVHSDLVLLTANKRVVKSTHMAKGRVGVVTDGGSGHRPAFIGYVGKNLCDAVAWERYAPLHWPQPFSGCLPRSRR